MWNNSRKFLIFKEKCMDFNSVLSNIGDKLPRDGLAAITLKEKFERLSEERKKMC